MTRNERIADVLTNSINIEVDLDYAASYTFEDGEINEDYNNATKAIVELEGLSKEDEDFYSGWIEDDPGNWSFFIFDILGKEWKKIADLVVENGY